MTPLDQLLEEYDKPAPYLAMARKFVQVDVDDVVQIAFMIAFQNIESFRGESTMKTWIMTILRNACLDRLRKSKVRPQCDPLGAFEKSDHQPSAETVLIRRQRLGRVLIAAQRLPKAEHMAILVYLRDGSAGLRLKASKSRGIAKLKKVLQK